MNIGYILTGVIASIMLMACGTSITSSSDTQIKPNIIVILTDDLGYGDVSCYGSTTIETPNIDALAADGVRFTQGYCTSATCTPSRYALLTGQYPWKNKRARILPGDAPLIIQPGMTTVPSMLREGGYATGVVGKWHLGMGEGDVDWNQEVSPGANDVGFDYSYLLAATQDRTPTVLLENKKVIGLTPNDPIEISYTENFPGEPTGAEYPERLKMMFSHDHDNSIHNGISRIGYQRGGKSALWVDEDLADVFTDKAKEYINEHKEEPFFLYFALHQPHVPRTPHSRFVGSSGMGPRGDAIIEADWCVGEIVKELVKLNLDKNTLIVFSSDNGPVIDDGYHDDSIEKLGDHDPMAGFRGGKYSILEAGTRVPFIVSWPGTIKPKVSDALVSQLDFLSSFSKLIDQPLTNGGVMGTSDVGRADLVLEGIGRTCMRTKDWYYIPPYNGAAYNQVKRLESGWLPTAQLYNIVDDKRQQHNVADQYPEVVAQLSTQYQELMGEVYKPYAPQ